MYHCIVLAAPYILVRWSVYRGHIDGSVKSLLAVLERCAPRANSACARGRSLGRVTDRTMPKRKGSARTAKATAARWEGARERSCDAEYVEQVIDELPGASLRVHAD